MVNVTKILNVPTLSKIQAPTYHIYRRVKASQARVVSFSSDIFMFFVLLQSSTKKNKIGRIQNFSVGEKVSHKITIPI